MTVANVNSAVEGTGPTFCVFFEAGAGASADEVNADAVQQTVWYSASALPPVWSGMIVGSGTLSGGMLGASGPYGAF